MKDRLLIYALTLFLLFMTGLFADARTYKVAVIDTGFTRIDKNLPLTLCKRGHYDFSTETSTIGEDDARHGMHGSTIATLIAAIMRTTDVCFIVYKVFGNNISATESVFPRAVIKAVRSGARVINISIVQHRYPFGLYKAIKYAIKRGVVVFVAAGNSGQDLGIYCNEYPACFKDLGPNFRVVGATDLDRDRAKYSNHGGVVDMYFYGGTPGGGQGTSFATPRAVGMYIKSLNLDGK